MSAFAGVIANRSVIVAGTAGGGGTAAGGGFCATGGASGAVGVVGVAGGAGSDFVSTMPAVTPPLIKNSAMIAISPLPLLRAGTWPAATVCAVPSAGGPSPLLLIGAGVNAGLYPPTCCALIRSIVLSRNVGRQNPSSARSKSSALPGRCAGSAAIAWMIKRSSASGISGRTWRGGVYSLISTRYLSWL